MSSVCQEETGHQEQAAVSRYVLPTEPEGSRHPGADSAQVQLSGRMEKGIAME